MKMRCWVCGILGLLLLQAYVRGAEGNGKPAQPLVKKGVVVKVSDAEIVIKSDDAKQGEVTYPLKDVSQHIKVSDDAQKTYLAEMQTRAKYVAMPKLTVAELRPGSEVSVQWGFSHLTDGDKVVEDGNRYQIKVQKLAKKE